MGDSNTISGSITEIKRSDKRTAVKVKGEWYSTFDTCNVNENDHVEITYTTKEKDGKIYRNIKHIEIVQQTQSQPNSTQTSLEPSCYDNKDEQIARAVALKAAVRLANNHTIDDTLKCAQIFYDWLINIPSKLDGILDATPAQCWAEMLKKGWSKDKPLEIKSFIYDVIEGKEGLKDLTPPECRKILDRLKTGTKEQIMYTIDPTTDDAPEPF